MERTLIKATRIDDDLRVEVEGSTEELLVALTVLVEDISKNTGLSVEHLCFAMTGSAKAVGYMEKAADDAEIGSEKSIDEIFDEIVGRSDT